MEVTIKALMKIDQIVHLFQCSLKPHCTDKVVVRDLKSEGSGLQLGRCTDRLLARRG